VAIVNPGPCRVPACGNGRGHLKVRRENVLPGVATSTRLPPQPLLLTLLLLLFRRYTPTEDGTSL